MATYATAATTGSAGVASGAAVATCRATNSPTISTCTRPATPDDARWRLPGVMHALPSLVCASAGAWCKGSKESRTEINHTYLGNRKRNPKGDMLSEWPCDEGRRTPARRALCNLYLLLRLQERLVSAPIAGVRHGRCLITTGLRSNSTIVGRAHRRRGRWGPKRVPRVGQLLAVVHQAVQVPLAVDLRAPARGFLAPSPERSSLADPIPIARMPAVASCTPCDTIAWR